MQPEIRFANILEAGHLEEITSFLKDATGDFFSILDASKIRSLEQVFICYDRAMKLFRNTGKARKPESIFLMLLSGRNQINKAQTEIGISEQSSNIIIVYSSKIDLDKFIARTGNYLRISENPGIPDIDAESDQIIFSNMARVQIDL